MVLEVCVVPVLHTRPLALTVNWAIRAFCKLCLSPLCTSSCVSFPQLEPLVGMWGNLLESASDYLQCSRSTGVGRQQLTHISMRSHQSASTSLLNSVPRSSSMDDGSSFESVADFNETSTEEMYLEDLRALVNRLTEAEQFGSRLLPDLLALSKTATWIVDYFQTEQINTSLSPGNLFTSCKQCL